MAMIYVCTKYTRIMVLVVMLEDVVCMITRRCYKSYTITTNVNLSLFYLSTHDPHPQDDNVLVVHFIGAFTVFIGGLLYQWTQSFITFRVYKSGLADHVGAGWVVAQVIISILSLLFFVLGEPFSLYTVY